MVAAPAVVSVMVRVVLLLVKRAGRAAGVARRRTILTAVKGHHLDDVGVNALADCLYGAAPRARHPSVTHAPVRCARRGGGNVARGGWWSASG